MRNRHISIRMKCRRELRGVFLNFLWDQLLKIRLRFVEKEHMRKKEPMNTGLGVCGVLTACILLFTGCTLLSEEKIKLRDLEFTVISEEKIPEQLKTIIDEKKAQPFQITYTDNKNLYICIGYGEQETGGYSIAVNELYLTDANICVNTSLLGPEPDEKNTPAPSYPVIVIKTEYLEQTVMFE